MSRSMRRRERGVTLMEMLVVVAIVSVVFIMTYSLLEDAVKTSLFLEEHTDLPVFGQKAVNTIQSELIQARVVFDGSAGGFGPAYFGALQIPVKYPLLTDSQQPIANSAGTLIVPDTATRYTGNCLLIARQLDPAPVQISTGWFMVDRYVFEVFYLTKRTDQKFSTSGYYIDAIFAKSNVYADYFQLSNWAAQVPAPTLADRQTVNQALRAWVDPRTGIAANTLQAWNPGVALATSMYNVNADGSFTAVAQPTIALPTANSLVRGLNSGRIAGKMTYSVGFRPTAATTWPIREAVPKYAVFNAATPDFTGGLEFLIVGPSGSRRILSRLVLISTYGQSFDSKEAMVITSAG